MSNDLNRLFRRRSKRTDTVLTAPEPEWRENLRDLGLMLSGIYQDLRGDIADGAAWTGRSIASGWKNFWTRKSD